MTFRDRLDAGIQLTAALQQYRGARDAMIIALPRGGVIVGAEVAGELRLPLDIVVPRKIGAPGNEEYAIGALTETGEPVWNTAALAETQPTQAYMERMVTVERAEAQRRLRTYRGDRPPRDVRGKTVLLVDDGIATGATVRAAIRTLRSESVARIVLAVPVAAADSLNALRREVDDVVCLHVPEQFAAVGTFYDAFDQTTDAEVIALLKGA